MATAALGVHEAAGQTRTIPLVTSPSDAPFWRDAQFDLHPRTYYFDRDNFNGSIAQAWAGGGWIGWQSGFIHEVFQFGATLYTSQPIYAPDGRGGTLLLDGQDQITTLGQAWVLARIHKQDLTIGRQLVDTPLINRRDNRMVPITFAGATLKGTPTDHPNMTYWAGYLFEWKPRDIPDFESMAAGFSVPENSGAPFAMVKVEPKNGWHWTAEDYFVRDTINTGYGEALYDFPHEKDAAAWTVGINDIFQSSVGSDLITDSPFSTHQASAKVAVAVNSWTVFLAGSTTGTGSDIRFPFGSKPNYTDMQQVSFDRAGEDAVVAGAAYDFTKHGWPGWSAGASIGRGVDAINPSTGDGVANRTEYDVFLQYRPTEGHWQGLRLQAKYANVVGQLGVRDNQPELRLIADYSILFKRPEDKKK